MKAADFKAFFSGTLPNNFVSDKVINLDMAMCMESKLIVLLLIPQLIGLKHGLSRLWHECFKEWSHMHMAERYYLQFSV